MEPSQGHLRFLLFFTAGLVMGVTLALMVGALVGPVYRFISLFGAVVSVLLMLGMVVLRVRESRRDGGRDAENHRRVEA